MALKLIQDKKAQAAITDALYFLVITAALSAFLFSFSASFGEGLAVKVERQEIQQYTSSAIKTILYLTVPRNSVAPNPAESDFLLAALKEDYFDDASFLQTSKSLRTNINTAMTPLLPAYDYVFYFFVPDNTSNPYPYFLFYKSNWEVVPLSAPSDSRLRADDRFVQIRDPGHKAYFCRPPNQAAIDNLFFVLTNKARTTGRGKLLSRESASSNRILENRLEANLIVWPSSSFPDSPEFGAADVFSPLNCCDADAADFETCRTQKRIFEN